MFNKFVCDGDDLCSLWGTDWINII